MKCFFKKEIFKFNSTQLSSANLKFEARQLTKKTTNGEQMPPILDAMEHTPIPTFLQNYKKSHNDHIIITTLLMCQQRFSIAAN